MPYVAFLDLLEKAEIIKAEEDYRMYSSVGAILDEKASEEMIRKLNEKRESIFPQESTNQELTEEEVRSNMNFLRSLFGGRS